MKKKVLIYQKICVSIPTEHFTVLEFGKTWNSPVDDFSASRVG